MKTRQEIMKEFLEAKAKNAVATETEIKSDAKLKQRFFSALANKDVQALKELQPEIKEEYKALSDGQNVTNDADGGFLVPVEIYSQIQDKLRYISPIRQYANVINVGAKTKFTLADGKPTAYWVAEGNTITQSKATFKMKDLELHKVAGLGNLTYEAMNDTVSTPALQTYLVDCFAEAIADAENAAFVNGDGSGKPYGFTSNDITPATVTAENLDYKAIVDLKFAVTAPYRANNIFLMNGKTLAKLVGLKDGNGRPLYVPALTDAEPDRLLGRPVVEVAELADDVIYFNYMKDYVIGTAGSLRIDYGTTGNDFESDKISVRVIDRVAGRPLMSDGFAKLVITGEESE